jgi:hypothetical protein
VAVLLDVLVLAAVTSAALAVRRRDGFRRRRSGLPGRPSTDQGHAASPS